MQESAKLFNDGLVVEDKYLQRINDPESELNFKIFFQVSLTFTAHFQTIFSHKKAPHKKIHYAP